MQFFLCANWMWRAYTGPEVAVFGQAVHHHKTLKPKKHGKHLDKKQDIQKYRNEAK